MFGLSLLNKEVVIGIVVGLLVAVGSASGERIDPTTAKFHEAYYLEQSQNDYAAAAELYEAVASDRNAPPELKAEANARLEACREELATVDLARLMPQNALAYAEVHRPGEQLSSLIAQLGLTANDNQPVVPGQRRVAISPELIKAVLGIRGVAVAITGIDPSRGEPTGVAVVHPGDVAIVRGLLETALPIAGMPVDPIDGYATYSIEGKVLVTLTRKLAIISPDRSEIAGVVSRLRGVEKSSIADTAMWRDAFASSQDRLLSVCINAKAIMPMIKGIIAAEGGQHELAIAQALVDLDSIQSVTAGLGVGGDGLSLDIRLRLDEGHRSLAFNFLRTPGIDTETLQCIPEGSAAFLVGAMNVALDSRNTATPANATPIVTALDIGRELFANIAGFGLYVLPPGDTSAAQGMPIPDIAAVFTVNDPAKSRALWMQTLGIASLAAGAQTLDATTTEMEGVDVAGYRLPEGVTVYFATIGHDVLISPSRSAMTRSIAAKRSGRSILDDEVMAKGVGRIGDDTTKAIVIHAGRIAEVVKPFMGAHDRKEAEPFLAVLSETVVSLIVDHSDDQFHLAFTVSGVPHVGDLISALVTAEMGGSHTSHAMHGQHDRRLAEHDATKH